jgi:hypothetical protein
MAVVKFKSIQFFEQSSNLALSRVETEAGN